MLDFGKVRTFWKIVNYLFSGLRFRLLVLVLVTCAPLVALTLHTTWEDRRRAVTGWRQRAERVVGRAVRLRASSVEPRCASRYRNCTLTACPGSRRSPPRMITRSPARRVPSICTWLSRPGPRFTATRSAVLSARTRIT